MLLPGHHVALDLLVGITGLVRVEVKDGAIGSIFSLVFSEYPAFYGLATGFGMVKP
ncbi:hypothetical protein D3C80_1848890 [compost metagenome]